MPYPKKYNLEISSLAQNDLRDIAQYTFSQYNEQQVDKYLQLLYDGMDSLTISPSIGQERSYLSKEYKSIPIGKHLIIFTIKDSTVIIIRIIHQSRDIKNHL